MHIFILYNLSKKCILKNILRSFLIYNSLILLIDVFHFLNWEVFKLYVSNLKNVTFNLEQALDCTARL